MQHILWWTALAIGIGYALYLVFSEKYNDGVIGRIVLSVLGVSCLAGVFKLLEGGYPVRSLTIATLCFITLGVRRFYLDHYHTAVARFLQGHHHG